MVFSTAITPAALGYIYDQGISIETTYIWFAIYMIIAGSLQLPLALKQKKKHKPKENAAAPDLT